MQLYILLMLPSGHLKDFEKLPLEVRSLNNYLKTLEHQVYEIHRYLIEKELPVKRIGQFYE
jgi:hypothetical protein